MKNLVFIAMVAAILMAFSHAFASEEKYVSPRWGIGMELGGAKGDNGKGNESFRPQSRGFVQVKLLPHLSTQIGTGYTSLFTKGLYETETLQTDIRLLVNPFNFPRSFPYFYAGFGLTKDLATSGTGYLPVVPAGIGLQAPLGDQLLLTINGGYNLSLSDELDGRVRQDDDLNTLTNQKQDGYFSLLAGLVYHGLIKQEKVIKTPAAIPPEKEYDTDRDGLSDVSEKEYGTNPKNPDTDGDGLNDGDEVKKYHTNPLKIDTDDDGLNDGDEVKIYKSDPLKADTDSDGLDDGIEVNQHKTNPLKADSDADGVTDSDEIQKYHTDPINADSDGDGVNDGDEVFKFLSDPLKTDTDGDGITDGDEVLMSKTDPIKEDSDSDGLSDGDELNKHKTNPLLGDTDEGGMNDGSEIKAGKDPLDPKDDLFELIKGKKVVMHGINFETNKFKVLPESESILEKARASMVAYPDVTVIIEGHTDNVGSDDDNRTLSQRRAQSVKDWLVAKGISANRMKVVGKGEAEPMATNDTDEGRAKNRRMEFLVE